MARHALGHPHDGDRTGITRSGHRRTGQCGLDGPLDLPRREHRCIVWDVEPEGQTTAVVFVETPNDPDAPTISAGNCEPKPETKVGQELVAIGCACGAAWRDRRTADVRRIRVPAEGT